MFRIGGSANNGIMSMAAPRKNYGNGTELDETYAKNIDLFQRAAGPGPSVRSDLGDLLISGGLNLLSGKGAGKKTLGSIAESYREPYQAFSKARSGEEANQRQIRLGALTQAITSTDAQRLANMKLKAEQIKAGRDEEYKQRAIEQGDIKLFVDALGMGSVGYEIFQTRKNLKNQGEKVSDKLAVTKNNIPIPSYVGQIPEGHIFYDDKGKFYRKTLKGYELINELGIKIDPDKKTKEAISISATEKYKQELAEKLKRERELKIQEARDNYPPDITE